MDPNSWPQRYHFIVPGCFQDKYICLLNKDRVGRWSYAIDDVTKDILLKTDNSKFIFMGTGVVQAPVRLRNSSILGSGHTMGYVTTNGPLQFGSNFLWLDTTLMSFHLETEPQVPEALKHIFPIIYQKGGETWSRKDLCREEAARRWLEACNNYKVEGAKDLVFQRIRYFDCSPGLSFHGDTELKVRFLREMVEDE